MHAESIQDAQSQIEDYLDRLQNDELNLSSMESHDDSEIIYMTKIIEDQRSHLLENFHPAFPPEITFRLELPPAFL